MYLDIFVYKIYFALSCKAILSGISESKIPAGILSICQTCPKGLFVFVVVRMFSIHMNLLLN